MVETRETRKTNNLQAMRKRAGFKSAREFAEHIGMSVNTYTAYEQGRHAMTLVQAWEFADILNCTIDELAGRRVPERPSISAEDQRILDAYHMGNRYVCRTIDHAVDDAFEDMDEAAKNEERGA